MLRFALRRVAMMVPTLVAVSIIAFVIIQLPPGDFLTSYIASLGETGEMATEEELAAIKSAYGLDQPVYIQYLKWMGGVLHGDFGRSMLWNRPVADILLERLPYSIMISLSAIVIIWVIGVVVGTYSATHQYSKGDYAATFAGFIGISIPPFLLALIALWLIYKYTGQAAIGLFSSGYQLAPWSVAKVWDLLRHLWVPALMVGLGGTASLIRTIRANLLDELSKPYVMVARSKGLSERRVLFRYPFRIAINPAVSTVGYMLPLLVSGELLVSMVLGLPTISPVFVESLLTQDMYLAGSVVMILSFLTVVGTLISDILLAWVDPRVREAM
ncbi:MAG: ABC transporter permease [Gemmatimonadota bacterium]